MFRFVVVLAVAAVANSQYLAPAITTQNQNTYRTYGNLGQVSTFSKSIDTPFSSVSKSDVRVSNPGYAVSAVAPIAHAAYASPIAHAAYASPIAAYASPIAHGAYAHPAAYARTAAYNGYASPIGHAAIAHPAAYGYGAPVAKVGVAAGLLGVAYSAAPTVAHMTYSNGLGINYAW